MAKIYVVTAGSYSDYRICGVYSTQEKADEASEQYTSDYDKAHPEEYELDYLPDHPKGMIAWSVFMDRDGNSIEGYDDASRCGLRNDFSFSPRHVPQDTWDSRRGGFLGITNGVLFYVWARDKEHAIKIANEKRIQLIVSGEWTSDYKAWSDKLRAKDK